VVITKDFKYNKATIESYYDNLKEFVGQVKNGGEIARLVKLKNPGNSLYNALDRKFATLKFYGFIYYDSSRVFRFNSHFDDYITKSKQGEDVSSEFLKIIQSSKCKFYDNQNTNFFTLLTNLLKDQSILYVDHIDVISYLQHYDKLRDYGELKELLQNNRRKTFSEKVGILENFYATNGLSSKLADSVHNATYLFSFLESNGFYISLNSLQKKRYFQVDSPRTLVDKRLFLSKDLLNYVNGFDTDSIVDELEYNADETNDLYTAIDEDAIVTVEQSEKTEKSIVKRYKTDRKLRNNAIVKSGYTCEIAHIKDEVHETFCSRNHDGNYVEVHHLVPMHAQENNLFIDGDQLVSLDQLSNLIVLCPICHAKLHYGKEVDVKPDLVQLFNIRKEALSKNGIALTVEDLLQFYSIES